VICNPGQAVFITATMECLLTIHICLSFQRGTYKLIYTCNKYVVFKSCINNFCLLNNSLINIMISLYTRKKSQPPVIFNVSVVKMSIPSVYNIPSIEFYQFSFQQDISSTTPLDYWHALGLFLGLDYLFSLFWSWPYNFIKKCLHTYANVTVLSTSLFPFTNTSSRQPN